jgi:NADH-quinone oxidoreductase subunit L
MNQSPMPAIYVVIALAPLVAAIVAGLAGRAIGRVGAHSVTIAGVALSCALSFYVLYGILFEHTAPFDGPLYTWLVSDGLNIQVGFLIDRLTALMMAVVTFVSLMVHIYTIGYMHDDPGYQRFFSYISLFTFAMLMLVMANNFMQLFFGWEGVGLVSYLLIGFWYTRATATFAALKAFLVNRIGDFGFMLGIAAIVAYTGSLDYHTVFAHSADLARAEIQITHSVAWPAITFTCICLFIGAMGKSAQVPLHVWLPDSMEGPTPISALIHAATMVTAGIFMVARMSPLFELSETALAFVLFIGSTTCFFMGLLGVVNNDIKRVIAYSTLSQLGYMTVALGVSAYGAGIFHLMTHAFFKALLFLAAGSVIIAMHHEQDMRKMGGLRKYMPVTYWTFLIGALALIGFPGTSGFFSKDLLIDAVRASHGAGWVAGYAYFCVLAGVFVTALYTFRMFFMTFHGEERMDAHTREHLHESPWVVTVPLVLLAIPSALIGWFTVQPVLFGGYFGDAIRVAPQNDVLARVGEEFHGPGAFLMSAFAAPTLWIAALGVLTAYILHRRPEYADRAVRSLHGLYVVLVNKYGFDWFNEHIIAPLSRGIGAALWHGGDEAVIDGVFVNGSARLVGWFGSVMRYAQSGYLYHYAFAMILGLASLLLWLIWKP